MLDIWGMLASRQRRRVDRVHFADRRIMCEKTEGDPERMSVLVAVASFCPKCQVSSSGANGGQANVSNGDGLVACNPQRAWQTRTGRALSCLLMSLVSGCIGSQLGLRLFLALSQLPASGEGGTEA